MATTTHAPTPPNDAHLLLRVSHREHDTITEALRLRLEYLDNERAKVDQALAAARFSIVG